MRATLRRLSAFLGTDDTILYGSCFDANGGLFETLLGEEDAVISDALNHASIIDGIRLCKAQRHRYANSDMDELERLLQETAGARPRSPSAATPARPCRCSRTGDAGPCRAGCRR